MYHLKYHVTKMNDTICIIDNVSIQPIYHDMIKSPATHTFNGNNLHCMGRKICYGGHSVFIPKSHCVE